VKFISAAQQRVSSAPVQLTVQSSQPEEKGSALKARLRPILIFDFRNIRLCAVELMTNSGADPQEALRGRLNPQTLLPDIGVSVGS